MGDPESLPGGENKRDTSDLGSGGMEGHIDGQTAPLDRCKWAFVGRLKQSAGR